jgi:hypothetical protein
MPESVQGVPNFRNMILVCENTPNHSLDKSMILADPGHGNALVAKTTNGHLIKTRSSRRLAVLELKRRSIQSQFDRKVNEEASVQEAQTRLDAAKKARISALGDLKKSSEDLKELLAQVQDGERALAMAKKEALSKVDKEEKTRSLNEE